eukprot:4403482-Pyramimonas_sp.AAC.1
MVQSAKAADAGSSGTVSDTKRRHDGAWCSNAGVPVMQQGLTDRPGPSRRGRWGRRCRPGEHYRWRVSTTGG